MSYYLINFTKIIDIDDNIFNFDNIVIGKKLIFENISKYYLYYQDNINNEPREIYLKLPILRLIYSLSNSKYNQTSIPIYPTWQKTNTFINFILNLEENIFNFFKLKKKNKDLEFSSLIKKKDNLYYIKTNINNIKKISSNINNKEIQLNDFKINSEIEIVIKISYIWHKENIIGLSSQLYQIKYHAPPEQLNIDFIDLQENNITLPLQIVPHIIPPPPPPPPPPLPTTSFQQHNNILSSQIIHNAFLQENKIIKFVPSEEALKKALIKLKKKNN
jgi:hypothetical protein